MWRKKQPGDLKLVNLRTKTFPPTPYAFLSQSCILPLTSMTSQMVYKGCSHTSSYGLLAKRTYAIAARITQNWFWYAHISKM